MSPDVRTRSDDAPSPAPDPSGMRVVAITAVRNEADIIEALVRHTATLCDAHLILDNGSTDATARILAALGEEGLPLEVVSDASIGFRHRDWMTRLMHRAASEMGADWVIPLDADEFLTPEDPAAFRTHLASSDTPLTVPWRSYVPMPSDDPAELNPVVRIVHRLVAEGHPWAKVAVPAAFARSGTLIAGSHNLSGYSDMTWPTLPGTVLSHFPVRSPEQYAAKIALAELQWTARGRRGSGRGFHVVEPFQRLVAGWSEFRDRWSEDAMRYSLPPDVVHEPALVADPLRYRGGPLVHTSPTAGAEPWQSILRYAHLLADDYAALAAEFTATRRQAKRARRLRRDLRTLQARLDQVVASRTWRMTRPLRAIGAALTRRPPTPPG